MKKIFLLGIIVLLATGCEANYNVVIKNDKFYENVDIFTSNINEINTPLEDYSSMSLKELFDLQNDSFYPIYFDDSNYNPYEDEKQSNVSYYNQLKINLNTKYGINYNAEFSIDNYYRSNAINKCYKEINISKNNTIITLSTNSKPECFKNYKLLNKLSITVTTDYKMIYNNADIINDNNYTWIITNDDYKPIKFSYSISTINAEYKDKENLNDNKEETRQNETNKETKKDNKFKYIILGVSLTIFIIAIIGLIKYKSINKYE